MKKTTKILTLLALCVSVTLGLVSCGGDNGKDEPLVPENPIDPGTDAPKDKLYSPEEQKEYLDEVGREFISHIQSSEISKITDWADSMDFIFTKSFDNKAVEERFEDCLKAITLEYVGKRTEKDGRYTIEYDTYRRIYRLSNFTGHFVMNDNHWTVSESNNLQFDFKDGKGKSCVLKLEASGNKGTVYVTKDYSYDFDWSDNLYINEEQTYIQIPEKVVMTLTQDGTELIKVIVNTDLSGLRDEHIDLMQTNLNINTEVTIQNFYFKFDRIKYEANNAASVSFVMYHNGKAILSAAAGCNFSLVGNGYFEEYDHLDLDLDVLDAKNVQINLNILGKVQVKGNITEAYKFGALLAKADSHSDDDSFMSYLSQAEALMDLGVYYNGGKEPQAVFGFEAHKKSSYYYSYWEAIPVLRFTDGTSYGTFESFFNEYDFRQLITSVEYLMKGYEKEADRINF